VRRLRSGYVALLFALVGLLSLVVSGLLVNARNSYRERHVEEIQQQARQQATDAAKTIDAMLAEVRDTGNALLERLNSGEVNSANAGAATKSVLEAHPNLWGVGITYDRRQPTAPADPNHYDTRPGGLFKAGKITYNYDDPDEPRGHWWRRAMEVGSTWVPPYLGGTTKKMLAVYAGRFYGPEAPPSGAPAGAIIISIQLDTINRDVVWSELGGSGYGFVLSRSGSYPYHPSQNRNGGFVSHPLKSYWRGADAPTFAEVAARTGNEAATQILDPLNPDADQVIDYHDEITDRPAWLFYARIPAADWVLGFVAIKDVLLAGDRNLFHYDLGVGMAAINGITCLLVALLVLVLRGTVRLWAIAALLTVTPMFGIGMIWRMTLGGTDQVTQAATRGADSADVESDTGLAGLSEALADYEKYVGSVSSDLKPRRVPAGVFVQGVEPNSDAADGWRITGIVWQRYANGVPEGEEPGFQFPEAVAPPTFEQAYDVQDGDTRTIGWRFAVSVLPKHNLGKYPLDEMDLSLRMVHRQIGRPIALVPDVAEYDLIVPVARPGLAPSIDPDDFEVVDSRFGFVSANINSTLGIPNFARQTDFPELTYGVHLTRRFVDPFVSQMMPLVVVALLLFTVHMMATRPAEWTMVTRPTNVPTGMRARLWGPKIPGPAPWDPDDVDDPSHANFYVQATLASVLALMFVTILAHSSLRSSIDASTIVYMEYAYFILYVALLLVALNSLLFGTGRGGRLVHWRKNLLPELFYWPAVMTLMFLATLHVFY